MKCVEIVDRKELAVKEMAEPIKSDKVIIEVKKAGICGSDIHNWEVGSPVGLVMGHEFSGVVTDVGNREDLKVGDRVTALPISPCGKCEACLTGNHQYCPETWTHATGLALDNPGAYAQKCALHSDLVVKLPDNVSFEEGAMVEPVAVGLHAIHLADIKVGETVLVVGGGIIGLTSAMFAKMEGAKYVAVSETNPKRGQKAVDLGVADAWFDATDPNFLANLSNASNGGFDKVIECCGNSPAVTSSIMAAKVGGLVVLVGVATSAITVPITVAVMRELSLKGAIAYTIEEFKTCVDLISKGQIDVKKFISKTIPLEQTQEAFETLTSGTNEEIKILIDPNDSK